MSRGHFWSRRKAAVAAERAAAAAAEERQVRQLEADEIAELPDAEILQRFGLPDPDDLKPGEAIAGFMRREIPERLRRRALRKLWPSNPVLACLDGLNDYDVDYTAAATDAPGVRTAFDVTTGSLRAHGEALARAADKAKRIAGTAEDVTAPAETPETTAAVSPAEVETVAEVPQSVDDQTDSAQGDATEAERPAPLSAPASATKVAFEPSAHEASDQDGEDEAMQPRARRMRFRFDTVT